MRLLKKAAGIKMRQDKKIKKLRRSLKKVFFWGERGDIVPVFFSPMGLCRRFSVVVCRLGDT